MFGEPGRLFARCSLRVADGMRWRRVAFILASATLTGAVRALPASAQMVSRDHQQEAARDTPWF